MVFPWLVAGRITEKIKGSLLACKVECRARKAGT